MPCQAATSSARSGCRAVLGWALAVILCAGSAIAAAQDKVELVVRGCLKGRDLSALEISSADDVPNHVGATFRLSGRGDIEKTVRQHNGHFVAVTGTVRKTALAERGLKVGGARIMIGGGGMTTDPTRDPARNPQPRLFPMQATDVLLVAESCPVKR